ncbi:MAG: phage major capsid protein, partial [Steroidobacteraceae bacterium]
MNLNRLAMGTFLRAMAVGAGNPISARAYLEGQRDAPAQATAIASIKMLGASGTGDFAGAGVGGGVASGYLTQVRDRSVFLGLAMQKFPFNQRIFVSAIGATAEEVDEGKAIPFSQGEYLEQYLRGRLFAAMVAQSKELVVSGDMGALLAILDDSAGAVAEALDRAALSPDAAASVFAGQTEITATGTSGAQLDADLKALCDATPTAYRDGVFVMAQKTATFLASVRTDGSRNFPDVGPAGGALLGLPVKIAGALTRPGSPPTGAIGIVSASQIMHAVDDVVELAVSTQATVEMSAAPTGDSAAGTQGIQNLVPLYQANAAAIRGSIRADWFARPGAAAFV